ncbi:MAG: hypothetical protein ACO3AV_02005 [Ilumatobacteraceae bacterium]
MTHTDTSTTTRRARRLMVACCAVLAASSVTVPAAVPQVSADVCALGPGGEYHAVTPARVFDSRSDRSVNDVAPLGSKPMSASDPTFSLDLLGLATPGFQAAWLPADVEASDVLAVVASVTIVNPTQKGNLAAFPTGTTSTSSLLNFGIGQNVPNLGVLRANAEGKVTIRLHSDVTGRADVLVDVFGWFSSSCYDAGTPLDSTDERGARLVPVDPGRILDTRFSSTTTADDQPLGAQRQRGLKIRGAQALGGSVIVPDDPDVVGVVLNVTAVQPTSRTYVSVVPELAVGAIPATSNLNVLPGAVKANLVIVPVGADGRVRLYNHAGRTNLVVDVMGYLLDGEDVATRRGRVVPLATPFRVFDTRAAGFGSVPLGPSFAEDWSFANFASSVKIGGVSVGAQMGLIGNLTNAELRRQYPGWPVNRSYLTVWPTPATSGPRPTVSVLNSVENSPNPNPVPNMALIKYGVDQQVRFFNYQGYAHYLLDVSAVVLDD